MKGSSGGQKSRHLISYLDRGGLPAECRKSAGSVFFTSILACQCQKHIVKLQVSKKTLAKHSVLEARMSKTHNEMITFSINISKTHSEIINFHKKIRNIFKNTRSPQDPPKIHLKSRNLIN